LGRSERLNSLSTLQSPKVEKGGERWSEPKPYPDDLHHPHPAFYRGVGVVVGRHRWAKSGETPSRVRVAVVRVLSSQGALSTLKHPPQGGSSTMPCCLSVAPLVMLRVDASGRMPTDAQDAGCGRLPEHFPRGPQGCSRAITSDGSLA
jgi:hypothetical protein